MSFDQLSLDERVLSGVIKAGYTTPTPIQSKAIPMVLAGHDVLALAQTGTGKTAAFTLPILSRLVGGDRKKVRALVLAPTRELAEQIHQNITTLSGNTGIKSLPVYGGASKHRQDEDLRRGVEIVVACPGRLLDHLNERTINLSSVEVLVLDEADRMCDMGFMPDIQKVIRHLPKERQTLFFSATMPNEIRTLANSILKNPKTVEIERIAPAKSVSHALYPVVEGLKAKLLMMMLPTLGEGKILVFVRMKHRAKRLAEQIEKMGLRVASLQGNLSPNRRKEAMAGFQGGKYDILVATDIAARGIDVAEITHVINYDVPQTSETYIHRIGRTGRASKTGDAYTFVTPSDEGEVRDIERTLGSKIERIKFEGFDYNAAPMKEEPRAPRQGGGGGRSSAGVKRTGILSPRFGGRDAGKAKRSERSFNR